MNERRNELSEYRLKEAESTLQAAETLLKAGFLKDSINRSYYSVFYAVKSVLAVEGVDFKRHKDAIGYFNQHYVASKEEAEEQIQIARKTIDVISEWHAGRKQSS